MPKRPLFNLKMRFELDGDHATVRCSNVTTCQAQLHVSLEDAFEGTLPKVEGWRQVGEHAYCGKCAERLPAELPWVR